MGSLVLIPTELDRTTAPHAIALSAARTLNRVEVEYMQGRPRRASGWARTQAGPIEAVIRGCFVATRRDNKKVLLATTNSGSVYGIAANHQGTSGGLAPLWEGDETEEGQVAFA